MLSAVLTSPVAAQELDCRVQIDVSQISGAESEYAFLDDLERKIQEYMNTRSWTDDQFLQFERISCSMQIVVLEAISISEFRARLIVTTRRPIYGTSQSSLIMRVNDPEWRFEFSRGSSLNYDLDRYNSLTSVLDFYAYLMLGYDYDTFSALGGTPYFERARTVADQAREREIRGGPLWARSRTECSFCPTSSVSATSRCVGCTTTITGRGWTDLWGRPRPLGSRCSVCSRSSRS